MSTIIREFEEIARLAVRRLPQIVTASECTLAEADSHMYRMAIFAAILEDKPNLDAILDEIERLARHEVNKGA